MGSVILIVNCILELKNGKLCLENGFLLLKTEK